MEPKRLEVFLEFLIFGVIIGIVEDLPAIKLATGVPIILGVVGIIVLIAIPFAILGELVIDKINFIEIFQKLLKKRSGNPRN